MMRIIALILLLCCLQSSWAEELQVNEIYETYQPADKLVPVVESVLGVNDRVVAYRNKLLVKAPRHRQDKLLELLQEIDRPLRNLLISVRFSDQLGQDLQQRSVDLGYREADKGVRIEGDSQLDGGIVVYKGSSRDSKIQAKVVAKDSFSTRDENVSQQIRVMEGEQGFLQVGEERPETRLVFLNPYGVGATTEYRNVGNGVYVIPQIMRDKIRLELYTSNQRRVSADQRNVEKTDVQSVLLVEPDVWTPFAGSNMQSNRSDDGISTRTSTRTQGNQGLELKVTILE